MGRYLVLDPIGIGGMGVVYAAFDPELGRRIALKVLHTGAMDGVPAAQANMSRAMLLSEAQAMARLCHPNVASVFDVGMCGNRLFVAMEYIEGKALSAWLREESRSWQEIRDAFVAAGRGLAAAHGAGIVHRDFKPDNVLIGNDSRVRVMDFGLARSVDGLVGADFSARFSLAGTPAYMAPEQLAGQLGDALSDQYSFCVALYEAWFHTRSLPGSDNELMSAIEAQARPMPVRSRPPALQCRCLARGLSRVPRERFLTMNQLIDALASTPRRNLHRWWIAALVSVVMLAGAVVVAGRPESVCTGSRQQASTIWHDSRRGAALQAFRRTAKPFAMDVFVHTSEVIDRWEDQWADAHQDACEATRVRGDQSDEVLSLRMACLDRRLRQASAFTARLTHADAEVVESALAGPSQWRQGLSTKQGSFRDFAWMKEVFVKSRFGRLK